MTRDEAMLKLLAVEPECMEALKSVTGWPKDETHATVQRLVARGAITYWHGKHRRWFYPVRNNRRNHGQVQA